MRIYFRIKWPIRVINEGRRGVRFEIDKEKLLKNYPFFKGANLLLTGKNVNQKKPQAVNKRWTRDEQAELFAELLNSGKVRNRAQLAKKFGVSRAWVTKVLS